ncbi:MAG: phosphoribosyl-ATP diphosphatase [Spirochaetia bacterium]|nr:phosphoribosyl-ATP diphosphatase [Spirochaetia bacterium]
MTESGIVKGRESFLFELDDVIESRRNANSDISYTSKLLNGDINRLLQKVGEESIEYILEATRGNKVKVVSEAADLLYHFMVSLHGLNLTLKDIQEELKNRHNVK